MAKGGAERAAAYLSGAPEMGKATVLTKIVTENASGEMVLDPQNLTSLYRKEIQTPTVAKDRFQALASELATWIGGDFEAKLTHLTRAGRLTSLMLSTSRMAYSRSNFQPVPVQEMLDKLPLVVDKIRRGDLARFVHLVGAVHAYGVCLSCGANPSFNVLVPAKSFPPFKISFSVDQSNPVLKELLEQMEFPLNWASVVGFCDKGMCAVECSNCAEKAPVLFDGAWVKALKEDQMCKYCAAKQLVNIQRPNPNRKDQRQLRRLIIS